MNENTENRAYLTQIQRGKTIQQKKKWIWKARLTPPIKKPKTVQIQNSSNGEISIKATQDINVPGGGAAAICLQCFEYGIVKYCSLYFLKGPI